MVKKLAKQAPAPAPVAEPLPAEESTSAEIKHAYAEDTAASEYAQQEAEAPAPVAEEPQAAPVEEHDQVVTDMSNSANNLVRMKGLLLKDVTKLGGEKGAGDKSMIALVDRVLEASGEGVIGGNDAAEIYDRYRDAAAKKLGDFAAPDQGKGTYKAQVSKLRQIIECGKVDGAKDVFAYARELHVQFMKSEEKGMLREKGTYSALVNVAREQLKDIHKGTPLSEDEIRGVLVKEEDDNEPDTALDVVISALKKVDLALNGRKSTESREGMDPLMDVNNPESRDEHLLEAREYLKQVIANHDPEYFNRIEAEEAAKTAEANEKARLKAEAEAEKAAKKVIADAEKAAAKAKAETAKAEEAAKKAAAVKATPVAAKANVPQVVPYAGAPRKIPPVSVARSAAGPAVAR